MTSITYVDDEVPDELPESSGFSFPGQIVEFGFAAPPAWMVRAAQERGDSPPPKMFVYGIQPLNFTYDRNPQDWRYERQGNIRRAWYRYLDKNGNYVPPNSPFGTLKAAYDGLGHKIRTPQDCKALIGKKFVFRAVSKKFFEAQTRDTFIDVPEEEITDPNYEWKGDKRVIRVGYDSPPTVDASKEVEDAPKLVAALNGTAPSEWVLALAQAGLGEYMNEATAVEPLIARAIRAGMKFEDGRLALPV